MQKTNYRTVDALRLTFETNTVKAAKALLGCILVHDTPQGTVCGKIVETEGYLFDDQACHASRGKTRRNAPMFEDAATAYVYFTYGMHWCFNVVTRKKGIGEAVLIRAIEPMTGLALMQKRRKKFKVHELCNGPAKLCQAMGINKSHNGTRLLDKGSKLRIIFGKRVLEKNIQTTTRIGITQAVHLPLRFYIKNSKFISRK